MRAGVTSRYLLGAVLIISVTGLAATRFMTRRSSAPAERLIAPPAAVQQAFAQFSDSAGNHLVDTLFRLGYHGGYRWDEKNGPVRPNLVAHADSGTVDDSTGGVHEGILSLDLHHDVHDEVPPVVTLRFVNHRDSPAWILLTTDGYPEDPSPDMTLEQIRRLPRELHDVMLGAFADRTDAFEFWKAQEAKQPPPATPGVVRP